MEHKIVGDDNGQSETSDALLRRVLAEIQVHENMHQSSEKDRPRLNGVDKRVASLKFDGEIRADVAEAESRAFGGCGEILQKMRNVLFSIEKYFMSPNLVASSAGEGNSTIKLGLELSQVFFRGSFCPYAKAGFGYNSIRVIAPPFVKLFGIVVEPRVFGTGLDLLALENLTELLRLLLESDPLSVSTLFEDVLDLFTKLDLKENSLQLDANFECFHRTSKTRINLGNIERLQHTRVMSLRVASLFASESMIVVGLMPKFSTFVTMLCNEILTFESKSAYEVLLLDIAKAVLRNNNLSNSFRKRIRHTLLGLIKFLSECNDIARCSKRCKAIEGALWYSFFLTSPHGDIGELQTPNSLLIDHIPSVLVSIELIFSVVSIEEMEAIVGIAKVLLEVMGYLSYRNPDYAPEVSFICDSPQRILFRPLHSSIALWLSAGFTYLENKEECGYLAQALNLVQSSDFQKHDSFEEFWDLISNSFDGVSILDRAQGRKSIEKTLAYLFVQVIAINDEFFSGKNYQVVQGSIASLSILLQAVAYSSPGMSSNCDSIWFLLNKASICFSNFRICLVKDMANDQSGSIVSILIDCCAILVFKLNEEVLRSETLPGVSEIGTEQIRSSLLNSCLQMFTFLEKFECFMQLGRSSRYDPIENFGFCLNFCGDKGTASILKKSAIWVGRNKEILRFCMTLSTDGRIVVLLSNFPLNWYCSCLALVGLPRSQQLAMNEKDFCLTQNVLQLCIGIVSSCLMSCSHSLRVRPILQIPVLISNLSISFMALQSYCESIFACSSSPTTAFSTKLEPPLRTFVGLIGKLESLVSNSGKNPATEEILLACIETSRLVFGLPLSDNAGKTDTLKRRIGDVFAAIILFWPWLKTTFDFIKVSKKSSLLVAFLKCSCDMFRWTVWNGIRDSRTTPLRGSQYKVILSWMLNLLQHEDEIVRKAIADQISVFIEGCGGCCQCAEKSCSDTEYVVEENSPGRGDILYSLFGNEDQTDNMSDFLQEIRRYLGENYQKREAKLHGTSLVSLSAFFSEARTYVSAIATVGCAADRQYVVGDVKHGANLLSWSLLMLTQQLAIVIARVDDLSKQIHEISTDSNESNEESKRLLRHVQANIDLNKNLQQHIYNQFFRIATARKSDIDPVLAAANRRSMVYGVFQSVSSKLYPPLFTMLFSKPLMHTARRTWIVLLEDVILWQTSDKNEDKFLVCNFVKNALPKVLPELLRQINVDALLAIAHCLYLKAYDKNPEDADGHSITVTMLDDTNLMIQRLLVENHDAWVVDLVEDIVTEGKAEDTAYEMMNMAAELASNAEDLGDKTSVCRTWANILRLCRFSIGELFIISESVILSQIVMKLVPHPETGFGGHSAEKILGLVAVYRSARKTMSQGSANRRASDDDNEECSFLETFLHTKFMYMMSVVSEVIQDTDKSTIIRLHALRCARRLLDLLGKHPVDIYLPKILSTIRATLQKSNFDLQNEACDFMHDLLRRLRIGTIKANICGLVVALLPCMAEMGQKQYELAVKASRVIYQLIDSHSEALNDRFSDIRELLPSEHPALKSVYQLIERKSGHENFCLRLHRLTNLIKHKADNVRLLALEELLRVLRIKSHEIHLVLLGKDEQISRSDESLTISPEDRKESLVSVLSTLIGVLLKYSRTAEAGGYRSTAKANLTRKVRLTCSDCLGELGAIDPAKLDQTLVRNALMDHQHVLLASHALNDYGSSDINREGMPIELGNDRLAAFIIEFYLIDALGAAPDPNSHMHVGMAIQELLRFLRQRGFHMDELEKSSDPSKHVKTLFRSLSEDEVDLVKPFWYTNYTMTTYTTHSNDGSSFLVSGFFEKGIVEWVTYLSKLCGGKQAGIMRALLVLRRYSGVVDLWLFILPYAIQNVLCTYANSSECSQRDEIRDHILEILREPWRRGTGESGVVNSTDNNPSKRRATGGRVKQSTHVVFYLLDTLRSWQHQMNVCLRLANRNSQSATNSMRPSYASGTRFLYDGEFEDKTQVGVLLKQIPHRLLAEAAFRCGSYARALKYFEMHARETHTFPVCHGGSISPGSWIQSRPIQFERDEIAFLYAVYSELRSEPDGLSGISQLRNRHNGGPGTGYMLGNSSRTVSSWPVAVNQSLVLERIRERFDLPLEFLSKNKNKMLAEPPGTRAGDGGQTTFEEDAYECEFDGRWDEALACYERMLELNLNYGEPSLCRNAQSRNSNDVNGDNHQSHFYYNTRGNPTGNRIEIHIGRLRCLRRLYRFNLVASLAKELIKSEVGAKHVFQPFLFEALWRLGKWSELEDSLASASTSSSLQEYTQLGQASEVMMMQGLNRMEWKYPFYLAKSMLALAKLSSWSENTVADSSSAGDGCKGLEALKADFNSYLNECKLQIMEYLSAASMTSHMQGYPFLLRLQALSELKKGWHIVDLARKHRGRRLLGVRRNSAIDDIDMTVMQQELPSVSRVSRDSIRANLNTNQWKDRFKITLPSVDMREELLEVRRVIYRLGELGADELSGLLCLAKTCMASGSRASCISILQQVHDSANKILKSGDQEKQSLSSCSASEIVESEVALCKAKLYKSELFRSSDIYKALCTLEPIELDLRLLIDQCKNAQPLLRKALAENLLQATTYLAESHGCSGKEMIDRYETVRRIEPTNADAYFGYAKLLEQMLNRATEKEELNVKSKYSGSEFAVKHRNEMHDVGSVSTDPIANADLESYKFVQLVIKAYGESLYYGGYETLYEALPKILSIWFSQSQQLEVEVSLESSKESSTVTRRKSPAKRPRRRGASALMASTASNGKGGSAVSVKAEALRKINSCIEDLYDRLPANVWYQAIPQLISHLEVESASIWSLVKRILVKIANSYPSQAFWSMVGLLKSNVQERRGRAEEIFKDLKDAFPHISKRIAAADVLFDDLIRITKHKTKGRERKLDLNHVEDIDVSRIKDTLSSCTLCMPTQRKLLVTMSLPSRLKEGIGRDTARSSDGAYGIRHNVTDANLEEPDWTESTLKALAPPSYVTEFDPLAGIMLSKERPKKILFKSSDGKSKYFLAKSEHRGDLRKDARTMEFAAVVNNLFRRNIHAQRRKLQLRTFAVTCLNENCGLIEWVDNTLGLRFVIQRLYAQESDFVSFNEALRTARIVLDAAQSESLHSVDSVLGKYHDQCQTFPPIMHKWFLKFSEPEDWLQARGVYTHSCAVWSMVGYIIGLGDRHTENVLLDVNTGEIVHVDFDCLFDKGLSLARPEIVPFRLTRHLVDGMDLCGVDGKFRRVCEVSLQALRGNKNTLLSVLESFVVDPLVEWTRVKQTQRAYLKEDSSQTDRQVPEKNRSNIRKASRKQTRDANLGKVAARSKLKVINDRLDGVFRERTSDNSDVKVWEVMPLSPEGQVNKLIQEATSARNLARMYSGWAPFL